MIDFDAWRNVIKEYKVDKQSREEHAEVHTPEELINDMLDQISEEKFGDPSATFLDPCSGLGDFPLEICDRLMQGIRHSIPNESERYRHIMENQIYMVEIQHDNALRIVTLFTNGGEIPLDLNLKICDALELDVENMRPEDWTLQEPHRTCYRFKRKEPKRSKPSIWRHIPEEIGRKRKNPVMEFQVHEDKLGCLYSYFRRNCERLTPKASRLASYSPNYHVEIHKN
ncbi:hypothetical protein [Salinibacter ruber]|uniref:hypothetical protein n=1 Tax=Salinibacter ruber TaxID=146919 RepID=UPI0021689248|nr:hypothetical protein [Salinibacter ruber]MCS3822677.1 hypothetical protein [Salinibacter ruber]